jgi:hypothetical protein|tara:strand:+ start:1043 stop:2119 length:1077 start_codon:yes stop_codon:yes gene_type:complete
MGDLTGQTVASTYSQLLNVASLDATYRNVTDGDGTASGLTLSTGGVRASLLNATDAVTFDTTLGVTGLITASGGVTGNVTGDLTGDATGDLTGNIKTTDASAAVTTILNANVGSDDAATFTGNVTGSADTLTTSRTISATGDIAWTSAAFDGSGDVAGVATISDNSVTPAKMEDGTQGDVLVYGASGAPERLGTGTSGQVLTAGGTGATPSWTTVSTQVIGFTSNQGTPTTTTLGSSYTHFGTCTLTLPADKAWLWVKVVTSFRSNEGQGVSEAFKITTDSDGTTLLDSTASSAGWVYVDSLNSNHSEKDSNNIVRIAEGVPTGHTTDTTLDLKIYMIGSGGGDYHGWRSLYAVGQYA